MFNIDLQDNMPGSYEFVFAGDDHHCVRGYSHKALAGFIHRVKAKKNTFVGIGGDNIDCMNPLDPRYEVDMYKTLHARASSQRDEFIQSYTPLKGRILYIMDGNHEERIHNVFEVSKDIAKAFEVPYAGRLAKLHFPTWKALHWHPECTVYSAAKDATQRYINECLSIKTKLMNVGGASDCDGLVMGHIHKVRILPPSCLRELITPSKGMKLIHKYPQPIRKQLDGDTYYYDPNDQWFASSGSLMTSYVEGYTSYAEKRGYHPTDLGFVAAVVKNDKFQGLKEMLL
jgi:UDP-2,3-diacylglucosamine pyrophosphatase LpxH